MKKILTILASSLMILAVSCQKEISQSSSADSMEITLVAAEQGSDDSKTYIDGNTIKWGTGEYVMMYYNDGSDKYAKSSDASASSGNGKASTSFTFSISPSSASSYTLGGVYPYGAVKSTSSATAVGIELPSEQNATASSYDPAAYVMILKPEVLSSIPSQWTAWFRRAVALNKLTLTGVKESVYRVELTAANGINLAGTKAFNLRTGANGAVSSGVNSVAVNYASPLSSGSVNVWFTSWDSVIPAGSTLTIKVYGASKYYSKTITATGSGIKFSESDLNNLSVDFSSVAGTSYTLKDFAQAYTKALDTWKNTETSGLDVGGTTISGHYVPEDFTVKVGAVSYSKSNTYDIALKGLVSLLGGSTINMAIPSPSNYTWAPSPYNEAAGNGGEFKNATVDLDFLQNYAGREQTYAQQNNRWSNFCNYTDSNGNVVDKGTPSVAGKYQGACCISRSYLIMARFYQYLLENNITSNISSACSSMMLDASLYKYTEPAEDNMYGFAKAFAGLLDVWKSTSGSKTVGDVTFSGNYIPADAYITVGTTKLNKANAYDVACQGLVKLMAGGSLNDAVPAIHNYSWGGNPYLESANYGGEFQTATVDLDFIRNYVSRVQTYAVSSNLWSNFCNYTDSSGAVVDKGTPSVAGKYAGVCCLERSLLILARFYKYLIDNNIMSGISTACASMKLSSDLYGTDIPVPDEGDVLDESDFTNVITIVYNGSTANVTNGSKLTVTQDGAHVTVGTKGAEGKKVKIQLSGSTTNGSLKIYNGHKTSDIENTRKKIFLSLNGVSITSTKGPAINIQESKTVYLKLEPGTTNTLVDASTYSGIPSDEDAKGAFFSENQVCVSGTGSLSVTGKKNHAFAVDDYIHIFEGKITVPSASNDALKSNDNIFIDGGTLNLSVSAAASKAINSEGSIVISGGNLTLKTTGNAMYDSTDRDTSSSICIKADASVSISGGTINCSSSGSGGKAIKGVKVIFSGNPTVTAATSGSKYTYSSSLKSSPKAIKGTSSVEIKGGKITVTTKGSGGEGIESKASMVVSGGYTSVVAYDDAINVKTTYTQNGGMVFAQGTNNDALDSNYGKANAVVINGGVLMALSARSPEEGIDADNESRITFNGGTIFTSGGMQGGGPGGSSSNHAVCNQPPMHFKTKSWSSTGYFVINKSSGNVIMACKFPRSMSQNYSYASSSLFKSGTTYKYGFTSSAPSGATTSWSGYYYSGGSASVSTGSFTAGSGYTSL
ncbi:MAG: carbohydrate-binding domain-containing protein [Bacteroidales bacterium]|nr:carbohydrate-binding domain-containing protein [Bacteroidales bacterium]